MPPLLSALLLPLLAQAAERVSLPADEPAAAWAPALAAAGLVLAPSPERADAIFHSEGANLDIFLRGGQHIRVARPRTDAARADLAMLVASLVEPGGSLDWASVPAALPPPPFSMVAVTAPPPAPAPRPATPPSGSALGTLPLPVDAPGRRPPRAVVPLALLSEAVLVEEIEEKTPLAAWAELGFSGELRSDVAAAPGLDFGGGPQGERWRAGFRARLGQQTALSSLGGDRDLRASGGALGFWARPIPSFEVGLLAGTAWRTYSQEGSPVRDAVVPTLGLDLRADVPLTGRFSLAPGLGVVRDLRASAALVGDDPEIPLSPWAFSAGITFRVCSGDQDLALRPL